ncbi:MAG: response regulator [Chloroflexi bacterium]|nr:response regulator [Chloroflexota bacterium]
MSTWMLVEDELDIRNVVKVMFQVWGHSVLEFSNGRDAVAFIESVDNGTFAGDLPVFMLSDIRMPGPNGNEIAHRMRESEKLGKIPVILMTAFQLSESEQMEFRTKDGVNRIIFKPLPDFDKFHNMIMEVLNGKYEPPLQ